MRAVLDGRGLVAEVLAASLKQRRDAAEAADPKVIPIDSARRRDR